MASQDHLAGRVLVQSGDDVGESLLANNGVGGESVEFHRPTYGQ